MHSYIHQAVPGSEGGPLLVLAHGTGGDENQFLDLGRDLVPDAFMVAPRGDVSENGSLRFFRRTAEGVYDMADLERGAAKMAAFIRAHAVRVSSSRTIGLGYSNGANILAAALFRDPALFDDLILMHPLIPFEPRIAGDLSGVRILITAGRRDPICPPELTSRLESYLRSAGGQLIVEWHQGGHEVRQSEIDAARVFLARNRSGTDG
jgi:phospholipase/carboxylesterase